MNWTRWMLRSKFWVGRVRTYAHRHRPLHCQFSQFMCGRPIQPEEDNRAHCRRIGKRRARLLRTQHTHIPDANPLFVYWVLAAHRIYIYMLQFTIVWTLVGGVDFNFIQLISHCTFNCWANASRTSGSIVVIYAFVPRRKITSAKWQEIAARKMCDVVALWIPSWARCCHSGIIESALW